MGLIRKAANRISPLYKLILTEYAACSHKDQFKLCVKRFHTDQVQSKFLSSFKQVSSSLRNSRVPTYSFLERQCFSNYRAVPCRFPWLKPKGLPQLKEEEKEYEESYSPENLPESKSQDEEAAEKRRRIQLSEFPPKQHPGISIEDLPNMASEKEGEVTIVGQEEDENSPAIEYVKLRKHTAPTPLDYTVLKACVSELRESFVPSRIDQVVQPSQTTLSLLLRKRACRDKATTKQWLYLCWNKLRFRICSGPSPYHNDYIAIKKMYLIDGKINPILKGKFVLDINMPREWETIVRLEIGPRTGEVTHFLYLEQNELNLVVLTNRHGQILVSGSQKTKKHPIRRPYKQKRMYTLPSLRGKIVPSSSLSIEEWTKVLYDKIDSMERKGTEFSCQDLFYKFFKGLNHDMVESILSDAGLDPNTRIQNIKLHLEDTYKSWQRHIKRIEDDQYRPGIKTDDFRETFLSMIFNDESGAFPGSVNELVHAYYRELKPLEEKTSLGFRKLQERLVKTVQNLLKSKMNTVKRKERLLRQANADNLDSLRKEGELILKNMKAYTKGSKSMEVEDPETGKKRIIQLSPKITAEQHAQKLLNKVHKREKAPETLTGMIQESKEHIEMLSELDNQLANLKPNNYEDLPAILDIEAELLQAKILQAYKKEESRKQAQNKKNAEPYQNSISRFRQFQTSHGLEILVAKSNAQTIDLLTKIAKPKDIWFHNKIMVGPHALLRIPDGREASEIDIQEVANIAAFYTMARDRDNVDVLYTFAENVRAIEGTRLGQVIIEDAKSIGARPHQSKAQEKEQQDKAMIEIQNN